jgi:DNA invertase Pin-like site-specific DNA recombinase
LPRAFLLWDNIYAGVTSITREKPQSNRTTSTPNGRLVFGIFASIAEFERELIRGRVRSGIAAARTRGTHLGPRRVPVDRVLEAEKKFRRIKGYQEILLLKERLNPSRLPQKEVRTVEVA